MSDSAATTDRLVRFLLGQLPPEEREAIERSCFGQDETVFAELVALEDELRVAYAAGEMSTLDRRAFEARCLRTLTDRTRLMFARALAELARAAASERSSDS